MRRPIACTPIIADYHNGHPHILPKQFRNLTVEKGGVGAGTIIRFEVRALGSDAAIQRVVTEPETRGRRVLADEKYVEPRPSKHSTVEKRRELHDADEV